ncbi:hypothetical protein D3C73_1204690 [compost metagenome]
MKNIRAKSITADRLLVKVLSAISADLGKITAGEIYGTYIATAEGTYPRAEMSVLQNLFAVYQSLGNAIRMISTIGPGTPALLFDVGGVTQATAQLSPLGNFSITTSGSTDLGIQSASDMDISALGNVDIDSNGSIDINPSGNLSINGFGGYTGSFPVVTSVNFTTESVTVSTVVGRKGIITNVL